MSEKPMLFSAWKMGRVLAMPGEGITEMSTMRPMKKPKAVIDIARILDIAEGIVNTCDLAYPLSHYQVGDILWPREPWRADACWDDEPPSEIESRSAGLARIFYEADNLSERYLWGKLRPAMFLPKRFARPNRYEVVKVEVRRPQELTDAEIIAEGITGEETDGSFDQGTPAMCWQVKWREIHGGKSWKDNPRSWRYTFKEVAQ